MSISERLKFLRGTVPQEEFARKIGAARTAYQTWEYGVCLPSPHNLLKIYNSLGVNLHWLLTGEGIPYVWEINQDEVHKEHEVHVDRILKQVADMVVFLQNRTRELEKENAAQKREITKLKLIQNRNNKS